MAGKFTNKFLDFIGVEEEVLDEDDYGRVPEDELRMRPGKRRNEYIDEEPVQQEQRFEDRRKKPKLVSVPGGASRQNMVLYQPRVYEDTQNIIDYLKAHRAVIVNLERLDTDVAQRILDFMSGAAYALSGEIFRISKGIFLLAPSDANVTGNIAADMQDGPEMNNGYTRKPANGSRFDRDR